MLKTPPVYALYLTNENGFDVKGEIIIDASNDKEAFEKAEAVLRLHSRTAAALWADRQMIRQFAAQPEPRTDHAVKRRARDLRVKFRVE